MLRRNRNPDSDSLSSFLVERTLNTRIGLWTLEKVSDAISVYYKFFMYDIPGLIAKVYPPFEFDFREIGLEKVLVYGGPKLEELLSVYGDHTARDIFLKEYRAYQKKVESIFIHAALSIRWIPRLKPYHNPSFDALQIKTAKGRRIMELNLADGLDIDSIGVARGGLKYGIVSDKELNFYMREVCKTAYEMYGDKSIPYNQIKEIIVK